MQLLLPLLRWQQLLRSGTTVALQPLLYQPLMLHLPLMRLLVLLQRLHVLLLLLRQGQPELLQNAQRRVP